MTVNNDAIAFIYKILWFCVDILNSLMYTARYRIAGFCFYFVFLPHHVACEILVPGAGIKPVLPAVEGQS